VTASFPPIEIEFPDLARWAAGNAGLPYVWTLTADRAGPHVLVQALTHGNEVCGAIALDWLLTEAFRPARGTVTFCCQLRGLRRIRPCGPFRVALRRGLQPAMDSGRADGPRHTADLARARELRPLTIVSITCSISTR
jgi:hypothetical protein